MKPMPRPMKAEHKQAWFEKSRYGNEFSKLFIYGYPVQEIARCYGIPVTTVRRFLRSVGTNTGSRGYYARSRIREGLTPIEILADDIIVGRCK